MIDSLILYTLDILLSVMSILTRPLDNFLSVIVPNYNDILQNVIVLFGYFRNTFLWVLNWVHLPNEVITMLIGYITFKITLYFGTLTYKLVIKWYRVLKG